MIVLAVLLLVLVALVVLLIVVTGSTRTVRLEWDQLNLAWAPSALVVFLLGAATLLLAVLALALLRQGTRRRLEQRRELKRLRSAERATTGTATTTATAGPTPPAGTAAAPPPAGPGDDRGTWHDTPPERRPS